MRCLHAWFYSLASIATFNGCGGPSVEPLREADHSQTYAEIQRLEAIIAGPHGCASTLEGAGHTGIEGAGHRAVARLCDLAEILGDDDSAARCAIAHRACER